MLEAEASVKAAFNNPLKGKRNVLELMGESKFFFCALTEAVVLMGKQQGKISQRVSTNAFCQQPTECGHKVKAVEEIKAICMPMEEISQVRKKAALAQHAIVVSSESSSDDSGGEEASMSDMSGTEGSINPSDSGATCIWPEKSALLQLLQDAQFNWFEFVYRLEEECLDLGTSNMEKSIRSLSLS